MTKLAQARRDRGWTVQQLVRAAGLHYNTVHALDRGHAAPTAHTATTLAGALDVAVTDLFDEISWGMHRIPAHRARELAGLTDGRLGARQPPARRQTACAVDDCDDRRAAGSVHCQPHRDATRAWPLPPPNRIPDHPEPGWQNHAACAGLDPELFFPDKGARVDPRVVTACQHCAARPSCLAAAWERCEQGVWAGATETTRARWRQQLRRQETAA